MNQVQRQLQTLYFYSFFQSLPEHFSPPIWKDQDSNIGPLFLKDI